MENLLRASCGDFGSPMRKLATQQPSYRLTIATAGDRSALKRRSETDPKTALESEKSANVGWRRCHGLRRDPRPRRHARHSHPRGRNTARGRGSLPPEGGPRHRSARHARRRHDRGADENFRHICTTRTIRANQRLLLIAERPDVRSRCRPYPPFCPSNE